EAAAGAGARAIFTRAGLVDGERAAAELGAVEVVNRRVATLGHLDEAEAARAAGVAVGDDLGAGHGAVVAERLAEVVRGGRERQVPDVDLLAHHHPFGALGPCEKRDTDLRRTAAE